MKEPLALEWREIKPGMTVKGQVVRLETFGAFVEIGAERPGLIHISELSHSYVRTPGEVVREGDEVEAKVLEVNRRKKTDQIEHQSPSGTPRNPAATTKRWPAKAAGRNAQRARSDRHGNCHARGHEKSREVRRRSLPKEISQEIKV